MGKYQTLHCHTTTSDGLMTHPEVLDACKKNNIGVVAFTDHDSLPNRQVVKELQECKDSVGWVIGIEMSSGFPQDLEGVTGSMHIVGLFVDPFNKDLVDHCRKAQKARVDRMQKMVKNLRSLGFGIAENDCLKASGGEAVGRPHIVQALKSKPGNLKVIEDLRLKMGKDAQNNPELKNRYDEMMERGEDQYPYVLFLSDDSYIKDVYVDCIYRADFDKTVSLIRNAGGLSFLAHWFFEKKRITEKVLDKWFSDNRLDGAETIYGLGTLTKEEFVEDRSILGDLIKKHSKLESGGADAHSAVDLEDFANTGWYVEKTVGMVEKIIEKSGVNTVWSSLSK